jgi:tripartite-type tricarboxylate transporter receptor subunit TctC
MITRRASWLLAAGLIGLPGVAGAQEPYPSRPIKMVVPFVSF